MVPGVLTYAAFTATIPDDSAQGPLLAMALLYPASALLVQRRYGSGWLPTVAAAALVVATCPMAAPLAALGLGNRLALVAAALSLLQVALPVGLATAAIWRLEGRAARPAQLAGGVAAYLAGVPLALAASMAALVLLTR